jgi:2,4-didehydro-3-deoxy-L-rhamnonate hydrolase
VRVANVAGRAAFVIGGEFFDVAAASDGLLPSDPMVLLSDGWDELANVAHRLKPGTGHLLDARDLCAPVPRPRSIFGLVANYPPAVRPEPCIPMVFGKFPSAVVGPYDDIRLPTAAALPMGSEWTVLEAELAVVIGRGGRHVDPADALDRVAGLTVAQDITERVHEFGPRGSSVGTMEYASLKVLGKSIDTFCPLGPALVTLDEFDDPLGLDIECRLNGEVVQKASTSDLLVGAAELVSILSSFVTLAPGDVILTGTPTPFGGQLPRLSPGDVIETEISGIGLMRNRCVLDN